MRKKILLTFLLLSLAGEALSAPQILSLKGKPLYVPGEVLVTLKADASADARIHALGLLGVQSQAQALKRSDLFKMKLSAGLSVEQAVDQLKADPAVKAAQPNYRYYALGCSPGSLPVSDLYYSPGPPVSSPSSSVTYWPFERIKAEAGWATFCSPTSGSVTTVTVAVVDSGVDASHPNFSAGEFVVGTNTSDSGGLSTDDDFGHGTFVTGLIAAQWATSGPVSQMAGLAGMPGAVKIMPIKALDSQGEGSSESIVDGIDFAFQAGVRVFNLSLGGPPDGLEQEEIDLLLANNCVVVAAAGNESGALDYPAGYPGVISVGATDQNDQPAFYSNFGQGLDLMAPGGAAISFTGDFGASAPVYDPNSDIFGLLAPAGASIFIPAPSPANTTYCTGAGTSFSTPLVTATAALLLALNPSMTNLQVANRLINSAKSLNGNQGWDPHTGYGLLDVGQALQTNGAQVTPYLNTFNSPNPFSLQRDITTNITLAIDQPEPVELTIRDGAGHVVLHKNYQAADLNDNPSNPQFKSYYITWDGKNGAGNFVAPGVYFYTVNAGGVTGRNKIVVLKGYFSGPR
jgi:hypothetical protein